MSEMQNNRRHQAQKELGLDNTEEELQIEQSIQKEELRQMEKQLRKSNSLHLIEQFKA